MLQRELRYDELKEFFWTDSRVVLAYIENDSSRFKTYIAELCSTNQRPYYSESMELRGKQT